MGRKQAQTLLAALISAPIAAQDYTPAPIPPQIIGSPQTMTPLNGGDDSTRLVQLAFPFEYYGQTFTQAWVSSNGFVSFNNVGHLCCNGMPIEQAPRNTIYGLWTDLISGGNPYYRTDANSAVFGWYNTQEYGSGLPNTLEIALFPDGKVQWNYGDVNNQWHLVTAGLTGPAMSDSISIFYGQNVNLLDNTSYVAGAPAPQPEPEPVFSPVVVAPTPEPETVVITQQQEEVVEEQAAQIVEPEPEDAVVEEVIAETEVASEVVVEPISEEVAMDDIEEDEAAETEEERLSPDELAALSASSEVVSEQVEGPTAAEVSSALEAVAKEAQEAEEARQATQGPSGSNGPVIASNSPESRTDSNVAFFQREAIEEADLFTRETVLQVSAQDVAFVAMADAQYEQIHGAQTTTETAGVTYSLQPTEGPTFQPVITTTIGSETSTPSGQAQQMELLNMQAEMSSGQNIDVGDVNSGENEAMTQLAVIPVGYSAYTQARIPDLPFYQPRDIYRGRRIPDANMVLYRMMQGSDGRWQQMVDAQYE
jgi:hypothetical protein